MRTLIINWRKRHVGQLACDGCGHHQSMHWRLQWYCNVCPGRCGRFVPQQRELSTGAAA